MVRVLIVDDEPNIRRMLGSLLVEEGHAVRTAATGEEAVETVAEDEPDVVLLDLMLPGANGLEVLEILRERHPTVPVVMMSGRATLSDAVRATKLGAFHFIEKPLSPEAVVVTVASAAELRRARELSRELAAELGGDRRLVGSSPAMEAVRAAVARMAPTEARVLITGESGTGKELAATAIHEGSPRAGGPFVRVNSAAIPRELVESEMFGHEKGAFSGAVAARRGRFELADGGTLFLDEVADLGPEAQAKLLRALEVGEFERVGGERPVRVDVRVLAATNRDLGAAIAAGSFREDLFYRLNVLPLHMPPLRERREDIPELVAHFLERLRVRHGFTPPRLSAAAMSRLRAYDWPGNARELANLCERLAILHPDRQVEGEELAPLLGEGGPPRADLADGAPLAERLDSYERDIIEASLDEAAGNVAEAARRLSTDRANLYRRMRRLGIER
ncbi:MAG: sigma-54 dependent transcriptional regulator [Gemmatimonadota bacterium]